MHQQSERKWGSPATCTEMTTRTRWRGAIGMASANEYDGHHKRRAAQARLALQSRQWRSAADPFKLALFIQTRRSAGPTAFGGHTSITRTHICALWTSKARITLEATVSTRLEAEGAQQKLSSYVMNGAQCAYSRTARDAMQRSPTYGLLLATCCGNQTNTLQRRLIPRRAKF